MTPTATDKFCCDAQSASPLNMIGSARVCAGEEGSMRRRTFVALLGGVVAAWPFAARAQQGGRIRRIGVLMNLAEGDPEGQQWVKAFRQSLQDLGWKDGTNLRFDFRW